MILRLWPEAEKECAAIETRVVFGIDVVRETYATIGDPKKVEEFLEHPESILLFGLKPMLDYYRANAPRVDIAKALAELDSNPKPE